MDSEESNIISGTAYLLVDDKGVLPFSWAQEAISQCLYDTFLHFMEPFQTMMMGFFFCKRLNQTLASRGSPKMLHLLQPFSSQHQPRVNLNRTP